MSTQPHENLNEGTYRITGCPGSGKTTFLSKQVRKACETFGSATVAVVSFTNAAAAEIAGRDLPLEKHQIGTLHSFAYKAIGTPMMIEQKSHLQHWNDYIEKIDARMMLSLIADKDNDDLGYAPKIETEGDKIFSKVGIFRNQLIPLHLWPYDEKFFYEHWRAWKKEINGIDFTDMLELALENTEQIPWRPCVGFHDEANDSSRLMLALWGKWSRSMEWNIIAGDADQVLYSFAGVDVGAFLDLPVPDTHKRYLLKSFRCPRVVVEYSNEIIERCSKREPIRMLPREAEGELRYVSAQINYPEPAIFDAEQYLEQGKSVAFLTTCSYMLQSLLSALRSRALPFENKYRRKRGDWNPLFAGRGTTTSSRVLSFLNGNRLWSVEELKAWVEIVESDGVLTRGAKTEIKNLKPAPEVNWEDLKRWFAPSWPAPLKQDPEWLIDHALPTKEKAVKYPIEIIKQHGIDALRKTPQITVGTIHSVKGATFDAVYLFPDLSMRAMEEFWRDPDPIWRCWYVGASRAKESLIICSPMGSMSINNV